jgi:hypothetical protein
MGVVADFGPCGEIKKFQDRWQTTHNTKSEEKARNEEVPPGVGACSPDAGN